MYHYEQTVVRTCIFPAPLRAPSPHALYLSRVLMRAMCAIAACGLAISFAFHARNNALYVFSFTLSQLLSWSTTHSGAAGTFSFEVTGPNGEIVKYSFETKHADAINDLVQSYVDVLINMIKLDIGHETASPRE